MLVKSGWVVCCQPKGHNHNTSIWNIICSKHRSFFYANRWILLDRSVSISKRVKYFNAVVSSVACFGSGHRAIYNSQLATLDVHFRKLCRPIVGPPSEVDWNAAWNEILHLWNERTRSFVANTRVNTWSYITCKNYWNLAKHVASLPAHRWVQRLLSWRPFGTRRVGRPRNTWDSKLDAYCRYANLGCGKDAALDTTLWNSHLDSFVNFCRMQIAVVHIFSFSLFAPAP